MVLICLLVGKCIGLDSVPNTRNIRIGVPSVETLEAKREAHVDSRSRVARSQREKRRYFIQTPVLC